MAVDVKFGTFERRISVFPGFKKIFCFSFCEFSSGCFFVCFGMRFGVFFTGFRRFDF